MNNVIYRAAHIVPMERQLAWQKMEFYAFIHFGVNTFTDREWGDGTEDPAIFNPIEFDARQWVSVIKDAGMSGLIMTCKHHDGFCLWPSQYTEHSVKNSPWRNGKGDIVGEVAQACREAEIKFGVYLSPWDRHEPSYGDSPRYNDYFKNQLRELLTNYGEIFSVWFDGACGEGPNGKRQVYSWEEYYEIIRELQPDAVISIMGPDVRWCGNEAGRTRTSEWSVLPKRLSDQETIAEASQTVDDPAWALAGGSEDDLGSRDKLKDARELIWFPAETNTSIRRGWFYHQAQDERVKSFDRLLDIYFKTVGGNSTFLLNFPPDQRGLIHENDAQRARQIGDFLKATFKTNLALGAETRASHTKGHGAEFSADNTVDGSWNTYWTTDDWQSTAEIEYDLGETVTFNVAMLQEYIKGGQRVEAFALDVWDGSQWKEVAQSTTIGYKRLLRFPIVTTRKVRIRIIQSRVSPTIAKFGLFLSPA